MTVPVQSEPMPVWFIPHGGGPCFFVRPEDHPPMMPAGTWDPMERYLKGLPATLPRRPRAIVVASAHWIAPDVRVGTAARHDLLFDYYNFPDYTYELTWPAAGDPRLAQRILDLLAAAGHPCAADRSRGLDHGVFIPLKVAFPDADVPVVPISLRRGLSAAEHIAIGQALAPLRKDDVLIVGSGMSFHNMQGFFTGRTGDAATQFDRWLAETVRQPGPDRRDRLTHWRTAPGAVISHPTGGEEHLLPLMIAAGAAGDDAGIANFTSPIGGNPVSGIVFGAREECPA